MSGKRAENMNNYMAKRCAKLAAQGWTHRNIAETVGKKPEQIKALILKGGRLLDLASATHDARPPATGTPRKPQS